jgi:hypothetical protein
MEVMNRLIGLKCVLYFLTTLVCSTTAFAIETSQTRDCRLRQLASIDLKIGTLVLVPVVLDGAPAFMGLNTGIPISTISQQAAAEMKFAIGKNSHPFVNSPGLVSIDALSLGSYNIGKVGLLVTVGPPYVSPGLLSVLPHVTLLPVASFKRLPETSRSARYASPSISMINLSTTITNAFMGMKRKTISAGVPIASAPSCINIRVLFFI